MWIPASAHEFICIRLCHAICDCCLSFRLGSSEVEQVQSVIDGVQLLIQMEKKLEAKQSIGDLMPVKISKIKIVSSLNQNFETEYINL